jgi:hypothetical protein
VIINCLTQFRRRFAEPSPESRTEMRRRAVAYFLRDPLYREVGIEEHCASKIHPMLEEHSVHGVAEHMVALAICVGSPPGPDWTLHYVMLAWIAAVLTLTLLRGAAKDRLRGAH